MSDRYSAVNPTSGGIFLGFEDRREAEKWYDAALRLAPNDPELAGNLARTLVRDNRKDEKTYQLLQDLILKDTREEWVAWARERLALMRQPEPAPAAKEAAASPPPQEHPPSSKGNP